MSKAIYTGVGDIARKVPKLYVGVNGVARKVKKGYVGVSGVARLFYAPPDRPPRLPEGYTELEYIDSNNGQTINTGYQPDFGTKFVLSAKFVLPSSNTVTDAVSGFLTDNLYFQTYWSLQLDYSSSSSAFIKCNIGFNGKNDRLSATPIAYSGVFNQFEVIMNGDGSGSFNGAPFQCDTGSGYNDGTYTSNKKTFNNTIEISNTGTSVQYATVRIYGAQIYDGSVLKMDLVPCISPSGIVGMYDLVNHSLFKSTTNKQFVAGPAVY